MTAQLVATFDGVTVGSSPVTFGLSCAADPSVMPNVQVHAIDFSLSDPTAIVKVSLQRIEFDSEGGSTPRWFRGKPGGNNHYVAAYSFGSPTLVHALSHYVISGGVPFRLLFPEPIETMRDAESSTDHLFAVAVRRLDSETGVDVFSNIWFSEV